MARSQRNGHRGRRGRTPAVDDDTSRGAAVTEAGSSRRTREVGLTDPQLDPHANSVATHPVSEESDEGQAEQLQTGGSTELQTIKLDSEQPGAASTLVEEFGHVASAAFVVQETLSERRERLIVEGQDHVAPFDQVLHVPSDATLYDPEANDVEVKMAGPRRTRAEKGNDRTPREHVPHPTPTGYGPAVNSGESQLFQAIMEYVRSQMDSRTQLLTGREQDEATADAHESMTNRRFPTSPPPFQGPTKARTQTILREMTQMSNEMNRLIARQKDIRNILKIAKKHTRDVKKTLAKVRKVRKVLDKYWLPHIKEKQLFKPPPDFNQEESDAANDEDLIDFGDSEGRSSRADRDALQNGVSDNNNASEEFTEPNYWIETEDEACNYGSGGSSGGSSGSQERWKCLEEVDSTSEEDDFVDDLLNFEQEMSGYSRDTIPQESWRREKAFRRDATDSEERACTSDGSEGSQGSRSDSLGSEPKECYSIWGPGMKSMLWKGPNEHVKMRPEPRKREVCSDDDEVERLLKRRRS